MKFHISLIALTLTLVFSQPIYTQACFPQSDTPKESLFKVVPVDYREILRKRLEIYITLYKRKRWNKLYRMLSTSEKNGISKKSFSLRKRRYITDTYSAIPAKIIRIEKISTLLYQTDNRINSTTSDHKTHYVIGYAFLDFQVKDIIDQGSFLNEGRNIWSLYGCVKLRRGASVKTVNGGIDAYFENKQWFFSDIKVEMEKNRLVPCSY